MAKRSSRRKFLQSAAALTAAAAAPALPATKVEGANIYTRIGVRPLINGVRTVAVRPGEHRIVTKRLEEIFKKA